MRNGLSSENVPLHQSLNARQAVVMAFSFLLNQRNDSECSDWFHRLFGFPTSGAFMDAIDVVQNLACCHVACC